MPFLILLTTALAGGAYWYFRIRSAGQGAAGLLDMANDVRLAARRFNFTRQTNTHPADGVEDPRLLAMGLMAAVGEMAGPLSAGQIAALGHAARETFDATPGEATDMVTFGRWLAGQCGTPDEAARRLTRLIRARAGVAAGADLLSMIEAVATADGQGLNDRQKEAAQRIRRDFVG